MLEEFLMPLLEGEGPDDTISPRRLPQYFHKEVTDLLNSTFPEEGIGKGGPITWPICSPKLTPLDYLLWGDKRMLYVPPLA
jgi:hypothetical protein